MLLRLAAIVIAAAACSEPVVEMELILPANADTFDASCISGVTVIAAGANIQSSFDDYTWSCREIDSQARLADVHAAIRGQFDLKVPDSGISGVEIFGWSGPTPCAPPEFVTPDLIFHASAAYIGQDKLELKLQTTLDCNKQTVNVRPVELFTLLGGDAPSSANCEAASLVEGTNGWATMGQIMERPFSTGVDYWGGFRGADVADGIAAFSASTTGLNKSCLAYDTSSAVGFATGCAMTTGKVCAGANELDAPFIERAIATEALTLDEHLLTKWDSMVFVSVWDNGNPKKPIPGATIDIAANDGAVVYVDPPTSGARLVKRSDNRTGPTGLAVVFTNKLAKIKVNANGASRDVTVASPDWSAGAALVVMP